MKRILVVEDKKSIQGAYKGLLDPLVGGASNIDIAGDYETAISMLDKNVYAAHVLDGNFPRRADDVAEQLGTKLADEIKCRKGSYDTVVFCSGDSDVRRWAQEHEIKFVGKSNLMKVPDVVRPLVEAT